MYRDDFYIVQNIIGYTGNITSNPTVYFKDGYSFGRITQDHPDRDNIGRNKVRVENDYKISNMNGKAEEYYGGTVRHTSRGLFREVKPSDWQNAYIMLAIPKFKDLKPKYAKGAK